MTSTSVSNHYYGRDYGGADVESRFIVTFSDNDACLIKAMAEIIFFDTILLGSTFHLKLDEE